MGCKLKVSEGKAVWRFLAAKSRDGNQLAPLVRAFPEISRGKQIPRTSEPKCPCSPVGAYNITGAAVTHLNLRYSSIAPIIHIYPTYTDVVRQPAKLLYVDRIRNNPLVKLLGKILVRNP